MSKVGIIYLITNKVNGKRYVGKTVRGLQFRWNEHCKKADHTCAISGAIHKHGQANFAVEVIATSPEPFLDILEIAFIKLYSSRTFEHGYNMTEGGEGVSGLPHTDKWKKEQSKRNTGEGNPFHGKTHSEDTKRHWSSIRKGRLAPPHSYLPKSDEYKAKISATLMGNIPWNKGKEATKEARRRLSEAHKGKPWSDARRAAYIASKAA